MHLRKASIHMIPHVSIQIVTMNLYTIMSRISVLDKTIWTQILHVRKIFTNIYLFSDPGVVGKYTSTVRSIWARGARGGVSKSPWCTPIATHLSAISIANAWLMKRWFSTQETAFYIHQYWDWFFLYSVTIKKEKHIFTKNDESPLK